MNKKALEDYALFARNELETQIALSLNKLGIYKDRILKANIVGDLTVIEGTQETFSKRVYELRDTILNSFKLKDENFEHVVEEFAYTWFNRIIAIRFMEVHNYFDHGFKVLTSSDGSYEPDILKNAHFLIDELNLNVNVIQSLKDQNKIEELYRYILFKQCNALNDILPDLFDKDQSYMELLLPQNLLSNDSVIRKITSIPEEDFMNDVEVVGWLYQYYVASNREEYRKAKSVTKDLMPTLSQIFTPDWVVRYMAENSVGRIWLEAYPNSPIKDDMKYYVEDAEQTEDVKKKLEEIKYKNVNPEDIKIIEPCCGSGHILVYIFELLFKMYKEKSYNEKDIPGYILKNNLYGLDIDKRAAQLAKFSLLMKARSIDSKFFNKNRFIKPRVFEIVDSTVLLETDYKKHMKNLHFSNTSIETTEYLVETFRYAKTIGSLLKVENKNYSALLDDIKRCEKNELPDVFENDFFVFGLKELKYLIVLASIMCRKYDVMVTNPPYLATLKTEKFFQTYCIDNYPFSKDDLFAIFMEINFVKKGGFKAILNPDSWMFINSYSRFRENLIEKYTFVNMCHLGMGLLDATVHVTSFVMREMHISHFNTSFKKMIDDKTMFINDFEGCEMFIKDCNIFKNISQLPFGYWLSNPMIMSFKSKTIGDYAVDKAGMVTGKDEYFVKFWYEVNLNNINFKPNFDNKQKYVPYQKGGAFKRFYGNNYYVLNLRDLYDNSIAGKSVRRGDPDYYFKPALGWSLIGTNLKKSFRLINYSCCGTATPSIYFQNNDELYYALAFVNTIISEKMIAVLNPTLNLLSTDVKRMPLTCDEIDFNIVNNSKRAIQISKDDWDNFEISWDFKRSPIIESGMLSDCVIKFRNLYCEYKKELINILESNNKFFLDKMNLSHVYNYQITDDDLSLNFINDSIIIKNLISYLIGVLMGRYSLEHEGLIYAGGDFDKSKYGNYVDEDGIIPLYEYVGIEDSLTTGICTLVKRIYGDTYYRENLDFIANALDRKSTEGAEETINRYLNDSFYNDHLKTYKKRPIYWMLSSGKQGAFKCLIYLHRYTKNTLAIINSKYFLPRTAMYKAERERLEEKLKFAEVRDKKNIEKELARIEACEQELLEYGQVLDHVANMCLNDEITVDLDDGVKVNYVKFQNQTLEINGATIKKNLLVPFGLESEKKKK